MECHLRVILDELDSARISLDLGGETQEFRYLGHAHILLRVLQRTLRPKYRDYVCGKIQEMSDVCNNETAISALTDFVAQQEEKKAARCKDSIDTLPISRLAVRRLQEVDIELIGQLVQLNSEQLKSRVRQRKIYKDILWGLREEGLSLKK